jgi:hypothetical protein
MTDAFFFFQKKKQKALVLLRRIKRVHLILREAVPRGLGLAPENRPMLFFQKKKQKRSSASQKTLLSQNSEIQVV